jgi:hypothetical protein
MLRACRGSQGSGMHCVACRAVPMRCGTAAFLPQAHKALTGIGLPSPLSSMRPAACLFSASEYLLCRGDHMSESHHTYAGSTTTSCQAVYKTKAGYLTYSQAKGYSCGCTTGATAWTRGAKGGCPSTAPTKSTVCRANLSGKVSYRWLAETCSGASFCCRRFARLAA